MKLIFIIVVAIILLLVFLRRNDTIGFGLPPHEFAYGTSLKSIDDLPVQVDRFLSLEGMDPDKIEIETFVGNNSDKTLKLLIKYINSKKNDALKPLIISLKEINALSNSKEKVVRLINALIPNRDFLRDDENKDYLIVFVYYGLKKPGDLSLNVKGQIESLIAALDTPKQTEAFKSGRCPKNYLVGNINVYPLALENMSWHESADMKSSKDTPILEIRFMGLKGVFKYFLNEMSKSTSYQFKHLDGELFE